MKETRRQFLRNTSFIAAPMFVKSSVLGKEGATSPNSKIQMACIGVGGQGTGNMNNFLQDERVKVVAICDVDDSHKQRALRAAKLSDQDGFSDYRES